MTGEAIEFFYEGHRRLDWGLGNPNKTAVLIACLMIVATLLAGFPANARGRLRFGAFLAVFAWLGVSLVDTYSRGGIVALIAGMSALVLAEGTRLIDALKKSRETQLRALALGLLVAALGSYAASAEVRAWDRYRLGVEDDRSIGNRLVLWRSAPRMMLDAPGGWGRGNSGIAWSQWYQPLDRKYDYRTLVNSHLTRLVESGWFGRFLWIFGWLATMAICLPDRSGKETPRQGPGFSQRGIALGVVVCLGVGALFSSVLEESVLWVPVALVLGGLAWDRGRVGWRNWWQGWRRLAWTVPGASLVFVGGFIATGVWLTESDNEVAVRHRDGVTEVRSERAESGSGSRTAVSLIDPDPEVLGTHYGHAVRKRVANHPGETWRVVGPGTSLSPDREADLYILSGAGPGSQTNPIRERVSVVWLNPAIEEGGEPPDFSGMMVWLGSERRDSLAKSLRKREDFRLVEIAGSLHFIRNWEGRLPPASDDSLLSPNP